MKQNKKNLVLGGVLLVLLIMVYASRNNNEARSNNFLANVNSAKVDKIIIVNKNASTTLEKEGEKWKVDGMKGFYVKDVVSDDLNQKMEKLSEATFELVSTNGERKDSFKTDDVGGIKISIHEGVGSVEFVIGKIGPDFTSTYISQDNTNKTYLVKDLNIASLFSRDEWRDRAIFSNDKEKISKIRFQYPDREFTIEKQEVEAEEGEEKKMEWKGITPHDFSVNAEKAEKIVNIMSSLYTIEIPEQTFDGTGLEKNLIIVQATGEGIDSTIMVGTGNGAEGEEYFYAKRGDSDNIYLITKEQRDSLDETIEGLE